jgi:hypothetical protein
MCRALFCFKNRITELKIQNITAPGGRRLSLNNGPVRRHRGFISHEPSIEHAMQPISPRNVMLADSYHIFVSPPRSATSTKPTHISSKGTMCASRQAAPGFPLTSEGNPHSFVMCQLARSDRLDLKRWSALSEAAPRRKTEPRTRRNSPATVPRGPTNDLIAR